MTNYFVWEWARYNFGWVPNTPEFRKRVEAVRREFPDELSAKAVLEMLAGRKPCPS